MTPMEVFSTVAPRVTFADNCVVYSTPAVDTRVSLDAHGLRSPPSPAGLVFAETLKKHDGCRAAGDKGEAWNFQFKKKEAARVARESFDGHEGCGKRAALRARAETYLISYFFSS